MTRLLQILNLICVLALAVVCVIQWQTNRQLNWRVIAGEKTHLEQDAKLAEKDKALTGATADLDDFRRRLSQSEAERNNATDKLKAADTERSRVATERDQLKAASDTLKTDLGKWAAAVAARDQAIKKLAQDRNEAVGKFNDLATKYNAAAADLKKAGEAIQKLVAERNDAVTKFNDLATKYNGLVKDVNDAQAKH